MNRLLPLLLCFSSFLLVNCDNTAPEERDSMAQHTDDPAFVEAHEKPAKMDFAGKGEMIEFQTPDGATGSAYALRTANASNDYLFVIHEWWGLNDQIKREAERLYADLENVNVLALDLYDGKMTDDPDEAGKLMNSVQPARSEAIIKGALALAGEEAQVATIGWCFGGGWSLRASILAGEQGAGCVMYYGMPVEKADELAPLEADVLGLFAKEDDWINEDVIGKFTDLAAATGKDVRTHWFEAQHAFANPSSPRYNEEAAQKANARALNFLQERL